MVPGLAGMPRRCANYPARFTDFNMIVSIGGWLCGLMQVYFVCAVLLPVRKKKGHRAASRPWDGADGIECTMPSIASFEAFGTPPLVK